MSDPPPTVRNTRFMLRYGELLYDEKTQAISEPDRLFKVTPEEKVLWRPFVYERAVGEGRQQIILSLINIDPNGIINTMKMPPAPLEKTTIDFSIPSGLDLTGAWLLNPWDEPMRGIKDHNCQWQSFDSIDRRAVLESARVRTEAALKNDALCINVAGEELVNIGRHHGDEIHANEAPTRVDDLD